MSMPESMRIVLFINDSFFSYRILRGFLRTNKHDVVLALLSTRTTGSMSRLTDILKKASWRYFAYRGGLQLFTMSPLGKSKSAKYLLNKESVPVATVARAEDCIEPISNTNPHVGVAVNFDQIIPRYLLDLFPNGVINAHASKLPNDRGISPALWAYARGDSQIWTSIYLMDEGLDTGPLIDQYSMAIEEDDSAFSAYLRVCDQAGLSLARAVDSLASGTIEYRSQSDGASEALSWPDRGFSSALHANGRRLFGIRDIRTLTAGGGDIDEAQ